MTATAGARMITTGRCLLAGAIVALVSAFAPAAASASGAETFCVHVSGSCPAGSVDEGANLQQALTDAAANPATTVSPNTVTIGPGTYGSGASTFTYSSANPVRVVGAGVGQTTLRDDSNSSGVLSIGNSTAAQTVSVSQLSVNENGGYGIVVTGGSVDHVAIASSASSGVGLVGIYLYAGKISSSTISETASSSSGILSHPGGPNEVDDVSIAAAIGISSVDGSGLTIHRAKVTALYIGLEANAVPVYIDDSLVVVTGPSPQGFEANDSSTEGSINALNDTIVARSAGSGIGVRVVSDSSAGADVQIINSIVRGFNVALETQSFMSGTAAIEATSDNYDGGTSGASITLAGTVAGAPQFANAGAGDYHLAWSSPLIDASATATVGASSTTDLDGNPRSVTFTHGGTPVDLGAYEYQHRAPTAAAKAAPANALAATFDATGSTDPDPGDTLVYAWAFDDGAHATGAAVTHAFATPGVHTATVTVTDPTGLSSSSTTAVTVAAAPSTAASAAVNLVTLGLPTVKGGDVTLRFSCGGGAGCLGATATETTVESVRLPGNRVAGLVAARAHRPRLRKRSIVVASLDFALAPGRTATLKLSLNRTGRALLARFGKLPVVLKVSVPTARGRVAVETAHLTLHPVKHGRSHRRR
jgi:hypothetical protein